MGRSSETFNKREKEKLKLQKRKEKEQRKEERKAAGKQGKSLDDMLAYVDENGNLSSTPPDVTKKKVIKEAEIDLTSRNKGGRVAPERRSGFVKFYDTSKGFGFIKDTNNSEELFFHHRSADFPIAQNDKVSFDTEMGPKGLNAVRITKYVAAAPTPPVPPTPPAPTL